MPRPSVRRTLAACALLFGCLGLQAHCAQAASERERALVFAARRAALELAAGRPVAAAQVLRELHLQTRGDRREVETALLWAEAELLAGAEPDSLLLQLVRADDDFVRAQAAAHLLGLAARAPDSTRAGAARLFLQQARGYDGHEDEDAAAGFLLAALLLQRSGDRAGAEASLQRARGPAGTVARLLRAEAALAGQGTGEVAELYLRVGAARDTGVALWASEEARLGRARALSQSGERRRARETLETPFRVPRLQHYALLLEGQIAYADSDLAGAARALERPGLETVDAVHAAEAALWAAQVELDRGRFATAESLSTALATRLAAGPDTAPELPAELRFSLAAWHASRTRATLDAMAQRGVLRHPIEASSLAAPPAVLVFATPITADTLAEGLALQQPYRHGEEVWAAEAPCLQAARSLLDARLSEREARAQLEEAEQNLAVRLRLLALAQREMAAHQQALAALEAAARALQAELEHYRAALAAEEAAWRAALQGRMQALQAAVQTLQRESLRLEAHYPRDRGVRPHEETERSRSEQEAARGWIAAVDSLCNDLAPRLQATVQTVLRQREPEAAAQALAALQAEVAALVEGTRGLAQRLQAADALERRELAAATAREREAHRVWFVAVERTRVARAALEAELAANAKARRAAYAQAACDLEATAAFVGALEDTSGNQQPRLEHAAARLDTFISRYPRSPRADEALYRLGEVHLRRAALAYLQELGAVTAAGGEARSAALPLELYADAIAAFTRLQQTCPESPRLVDAHFQLGFLFAEIGSPEIAVTHLDSFLLHAPAGDRRRGRAALRLGEAHVVMDELEAAFDAFGVAAATEEPDIRPVGLVKRAWCAFELDRYEEARLALRALLSSDSKGAVDLQAEGLELLALCFAADTRGPEAAAELERWGNPPFRFVVLRRMGQLFAARAQYDDAIATCRTLEEEFPLHPRLAAVAVEELRLVALHQGQEAAHARAAVLAPLFAPEGAWARAVGASGRLAEAGKAGDRASFTAGEDDAVQPAWQSRLVEEDREAGRADSLARAFADPRAAAAHMAARLRSAAVFAHQQGRAGGAGAPEHLERAVTLYRQTLTLFPGAEGEPTTSLYLGEALFSLERPLEAAAAYDAAASHVAADSTTRESARAAELAALDRAAASDVTVLERYEEVTRRYLATRPADARGLDALERVGSLAFAASRYETAEKAYTDLAARTSDPVRATTALKIAGDTWYRRESFERAADGYAAALQRAPATGADSLVQALRVLVPGALFRAGAAAEEKGEAKHAATLFEGVATEHADFSAADEALYRAARLRASHGDTLAALGDYQKLVAAKPSSPLHPDALLELSALRAAHGESGAAAASYRSFAVTYAKHPQARPARLRAAELYTASGDSTAADSEYATLLQDLVAASPADTPLVAQLWLRRARLARTPESGAPHCEQALHWRAGLTPAERAEAAYRSAEALRPAYLALPLEAPLDAALERKKTALEGVLNGYAQVLRDPVQPWHAAACLRVGECLDHFGAALAASPAPAELGAADLEAFRAALGTQAEALGSRAIDAWSQGLRGAQEDRAASAWEVALQSRLYPALSRRVPTRPTPFFVFVPP